MPGRNGLQIATSILGGDFLNFGESIRICERAGADMIQIDVCDGIFVPTISFGEELIRRVSRATRLPVEAHLMVSRPEDWIWRLADCGAFRVIFHVEATRRAMGLVEDLEQAGWKPGIAINPETPAATIEPLLPYVDNVCILGIAPGFSGRTLLDYTYLKIEDTRSLIERTGSSATITVDGGVKAGNARQLVDAGADILVISSWMFSHPHPDASLGEIRRIVAGEISA